MPTILSHPAVTLLKPWFHDVPRAAIIAAAVGSILPDVDVAAFALGIPYGATFGHRGFTHSIFFAFVVSSLLTLLVGRNAKTFTFIFVCTMSHAVLDAMTNGGLGIAFFSPFSNHRYFLPWRPIRVSPIGAGFFSERGLATLTSELLWVWLPFATLWLFGLRRQSRRSQ